MKRTRKIRIAAVLGLTLLIVFTMVNVFIVSNYDLRDHVFTYMHLMNLPKRTPHTVVERTEYLSRLRNYHAWKPGSEYVFVDPEEPYLKNREEKGQESEKFYQILQYNNDKPNPSAYDATLDGEKCVFQNCYVTDDRKLIRNSSAVIFSLSHTSLAHAPPRKVPGQVWIFYDWEPPVINDKFFYRHHSWRNVMNWSMSYRPDSDVVYPYGVLKSRTPDEILVKDYNAIYPRKTKFAFWMVSNCRTLVFSGRKQYVEQLQKYIPVDIYGACGTHTVRNVTELFSQYKFYLSFENSFCKGYVTEKFFDRLNKDVVPVVRGGADYQHYFPGDTFIDAGNFADAKSLAQYLIRINQSEQLYTDYLRRQDKYKVGSLNWKCQLCAKLNNQDQHRRVYESIVTFWNKDVCWRPGDAPSRWVTVHVVMATLIVLMVLYGGRKLLNRWKI